MPRKPREELAGGVHHVFARGNNRERLFFEDADRHEYLGLLAHVVPAQGWRVLSYCLMANHVHLMVETPEPNLGRGMQRLHGDFGQALNRRRGRVGHVFQGRFGSKLLKTESHLWTTAAYIAANPVEAGLCSAPEEWRWSSHPTVVLARRGPDWLDVQRLFGMFDALGGDPRERYREMVRGRCAARAG